MAQRAKSSDAGRTGKRSSLTFCGVKDIERLGNNAAVVAFTAWISTRINGWDAVHELFLSENTNPVGGRFMDSGVFGARGLTKMRWVQQLARQGFSNAALAIELFDEIAMEHGALERPGEEPTICLAQFQRFQVRVMSVSSLAAAADEHSPAMRFVKASKQKRGTFLRAWRMDVDLRGNGKVAQGDFVNACRKSGFGNQAKLIWDNVRPEGLAPLELHELESTEANNLEDFAEALWSSVGLDLGRAWEYLDPNNQQHVTFEDFKYGAKALGFAGDSRLLFKGLDVQGFNRISRDDFAYILKVSRVAQRRLGGATQGFNDVQELIAWVQRDVGGASEMLGKLGLGGQSGAREVAVGELAARLTALGFEGNAIAAASRVARGEGGTYVSADTLYSILTGTKQVTQADARPATPRGNTTPRKLIIPSTQGWNSAVDEISTHNSNKCKHTKQYFTPPARASTPRRQKSSSPTRRPMIFGAAKGSAGARASSARRPHAQSAWGAQPRPKWNDNYGGTQRGANEFCCSHTRQYFSDPAQKPVRDRQRALVECRQMARVQPAWEQPYAAEDMVTF